MMSPWPHGTANKLSVVDSRACLEQAGLLYHCWRECTSRLPGVPKLQQLPTFLQATWHIISATALFVAGCILLVVFGSHDSRVFSIPELLQLYSNPQYLAYIAAAAVTVLTTYALYLLGRRKLRYAKCCATQCLLMCLRRRALRLHLHFLHPIVTSHDDRSEDFSRLSRYSITVTEHHSYASLSVSSLHTLRNAQTGVVCAGRPACRNKQHPGGMLWRALLPVLFSVFSALICTQSLVFNKILMVLWRTTLDGDNQACAGVCHSDTIIADVGVCNGAAKHFAGLLFRVPPTKAS